MIFHITSAGEWAEAQSSGVYVAPSLHTEGFIHLSTEAQVLGTAERFYANATDLVLLKVDETRCQAELLWEPPAEAPGSDARFPHLFGPLELDAVIDARSFARIDGAFVFPYE